MPRAKPRIARRTFGARPHAWSSNAVVDELVEQLLGHPWPLAARLRRLGSNTQLLVDDDSRAAEKALRLASGVVGTFAAADAALRTLSRPIGRPPTEARMQAIRRLRQIFARFDRGKEWGRVTREHRFIWLCLLDAKLIPPGFGGLRYHLRDVRSYSAPSPKMRRQQLERIANRIKR